MGVGQLIIGRDRTVLPQQSQIFIHPMDVLNGRGKVQYAFVSPADSRCNGDPVLRLQHLQNTLRVLQNPVSGSAFRFIMAIIFP